MTGASLPLLVCLLGCCFLCTAGAPVRKRDTTYQYRPAPESYNYGNAEPSRVGQQDAGDRSYVQQYNPMYQGMAIERQPSQGRNSPEAYQYPQPVNQNMPDTPKQSVLDELAAFLNRQYENEAQKQVNPLEQPSAAPGIQWNGQSKPRLEWLDMSTDVVQDKEREPTPRPQTYTGGYHFGGYPDYSQIEQDRRGKEDPRGPFAPYRFDTPSQIEQDRRGKEDPINQFTPYRFDTPSQIEQDRRGKEDPINQFSPYRFDTPSQIEQDRRGKENPRGPFAPYRFDTPSQIEQDRRGKEDPRGGGMAGGTYTSNDPNKLMGPESVYMSSPGSPGRQMPEEMSFPGPNQRGRKAALGGVK